MNDNENEFIKIYRVWLSLVFINIEGSHKDYFMNGSSTYNLSWKFLYVFNRSSIRTINLRISMNNIVKLRM